MTRVMPCLLLRGRALVKTIRFKDAQYVGDPINTVRIYNEKEVDELILLDITATPEAREPHFALIEEIASECFMPITYGGGIRHLDQARRLFSLGVEKVALNSAIIDHPGLLQDIATHFGSQSVVAAIDVKRRWTGRYEVYTHGGKQRTRQDPVVYALEAARQGAGEILLTAIDRDGTMTGYDLDLTRQVSQAVTVPVVACGGAGSVDDFRRAVDHGRASAVAAGSLVVYQGPHRAVLINFPERQTLETVLQAA